VAVHLLEPVAPTLNVPRMHPCAARPDETGRDCGATPAWLYRRVCAHGHIRDVWLCNTHEALVSQTGGASCRDCMGLGRWAHRCPVALVKDPEAAALIRAGRT
jgi:hypothetical protein